MGIIEVILVGIALSMDAFAVAVCKGLKMKRIDYRQAVIIALFFGGFQALMPLIGYFLGTGFRQYIEAVDHWIAFGLLAFIGGKMAWESFKDEEDEAGDAFDIKELLLMAVATSIDALAVGITFAFLEEILSIWVSVAAIGTITFCLSLIGVMVGNRFGAKYKNRAELAGGIVLILIGMKILLEHLGFLKFPF